MTDTFALERYAATQDPEAFAHLVSRYHQMVFATCLRTLGNVADAEDAAQETFVKLAHSAGAVRSNVGAWLHRTATNVSINSIRSASRRRGREAAVAQSDEVADPAVWREWQLVREAVDEALAELPEASRNLVVQRYLMGRTQAALAEEQGVSASMMSRRVTGAVEVLRERLRRQGHLTAMGVLTAGLGAEGAVAVPAGLGAALGKIGVAGVGASAVSAAVVGSGGAATGLLAAIKLKVVAGVLGGVLVVGGGAWVVHEVQSREARPRSVGKIVGGAEVNVAAAPTAGRVLRPTATPGGVASWSGGHFKVSGQTARGIVATAYQVTSSQIDFTVDEPAGYFDVDLEGPDWPEVLREAFRTEMGLVGRVTYRMVPTYVLRRIEGQPHKLRAAKPGGSGGVTSDRHGRRFEGARVELLRNNLRGWLEAPVIDETGIAGRFDFDLPGFNDQATRPTAEQYAEAIRENLGLELVEVPGGTRQPVVVVSKAVDAEAGVEHEPAPLDRLDQAVRGLEPPPFRTDADLARTRRLLQQVRDGQAHSLAALTSWRGEATLETTRVEADGPVESREAARFVWDREAGKRRWRRAMVERNPPLPPPWSADHEVWDQMVRPDGFFRAFPGYQPGDSPERELQVRVWPLAEGLEDIAPYADSFDPRWYFNNDNEDPTGWLDFLLKEVADGDLLTRAFVEGGLIVVQIGEEGSVNRYEYDPAQGYRLARFYSASIQDRGELRYTYEQKNGVWVPKTFVRVRSYVQSSGHPFRSLLRVVFTNSAVNEPVDPDAFAFARLGVTARSHVTDSRTGQSGRYGSLDPIE